MSTCGDEVADELRMVLETAGPQRDLIWSEIFLRRPYAVIEVLNGVVGVVSTQLGISEDLASLLLNALPARREAAVRRKEHDHVLLSGRVHLAIDVGRQADIVLPFHRILVHLDADEAGVEHHVGAREHAGFGACRGPYA